MLFQNSLLQILEEIMKYITIFIIQITFIYIYSIQSYPEYNSKSNSDKYSSLHKL